ncbi:MAG: hypothetical protein J1E84_02750 [Muribaculaceae bacterium]|nr:hypothetical protein [Muribaculaceae bacterium]
MNLLQQIVKRVQGKHPEQEVETESSIIAPCDNRRDLPDDMGRGGAIDESYKWSIAKRLVKGYIDWDDPLVPQVLDRMLDVRLCSMITYHIARSLFASGGADIVERSPEIAELFGMETSSTEGHSLIDHSFETSFVMPVKYRGYGHPVNSREHMGHLFTVNMLCFPTDSRIIGYRDSNNGDISIVKGMRREGTHGSWKLYSLDPALSDDYTAIFTIAPPISHNIVEVCHYIPSANETFFIYRFQRKINNQPLANDSQI